MKVTVDARAVRWLMAVTAVLAMAIVVGCGGGGTPEPAPIQERGPLITTAATMEQLEVDLTTAGKPLPEFLTGEVIEPRLPEGEMAPASYMTGLRLGRWYYHRYCGARRVQWYECNLTRSWALTDVVVADEGGDPDLYVFSPLRPLNGRNSLKLVGYSVGTRDEQVGSFRPGDFGGTGRFVVAVHAYGRSPARYDLIIW